MSDELPKSRLLMKLNPEQLKFHQTHATQITPDKNKNIPSH